MTPSVPDTHELLDTAVAAAQAAGGHALRHRARRHEALSLSRHDVKLRLDVECQERAMETIRARYPRHRLLGEEGDQTQSAAGADDGIPEWIVDPIDGTVNFFHGLPLWNSSVAVRLGDTVLAGAVYAPVLDELYTATIHGPARCNDDTLHVSETADLNRALICTGMDKNADSDRAPYAMVERLTANVQRVRILGSAALDLCQVARGAVDGYWESGIFIWDIAAAGLIVQRAGGGTGILERRSGGRLGFLAANAALYEPLKKLIQAG